MIFDQRWLSPTKGKKQLPLQLVSKEYERSETNL